MLTTSCELTPEAMVAWDRDFGADVPHVRFASSEDYYRRHVSKYDFVAWRTLETSDRMQYEKTWFVHMPGLGRWVSGVEYMEKFRTI